MKYYAVFSVLHEKNTKASSVSLEDLDYIGPKDKKIYESKEHAQIIAKGLRRIENKDKSLGAAASKYKTSFVVKTVDKAGHLLPSDRNLHTKIITAKEFKAPIFCW